MLKKKILGMVALLSIATLGTAAAIVANNDSAAFINAEPTTSYSVTLKPGDKTINTGTPIDITFTSLDFSMDGNIQKITSVSTNADGFTLEAGYRYDNNPNNIFYKSMDNIGMDATSYTFKAGEEPSRIKMSCEATMFTEITIKYSCDSTADSFNMLESKRYVSFGGQEYEATKQSNGEYAATNLGVVKGDVVRVYKKDPVGNKTEIKFRAENEDNASAAFAFSDLSCIAKANGQANVYIGDKGAWINMARFDNVFFKGTVNGWADDPFFDNEDGTYAIVVDLQVGNEFKFLQKVFKTDEKKSEEWWQGFSTLAAGDAKANFVGVGDNNFKANVAGKYEIIFNCVNFQTTINLVK